MADDATALFSIIGISALFTHSIFLVLNIQYLLDDKRWAQRAYALYVAGLFVLCNAGWIMYVWLWNDWQKAMTWSEQTFQVLDVSAIPVSVVAPTVAFVNRQRNTTERFIWVLTPHDLSEYSKLLNLYRPGYSFSAFQNPNRFSDIQLAFSTNSAALVATIVLLLILVCIWGVMVYTSQRMRQLDHASPPVYREGDDGEIIERSPPPSYVEAEEVIVENTM